MSSALPDRSIALVYGTRPEQIKLSVLITLLGDGRASTRVADLAELTAADHDPVDHTQARTSQWSG